MNGHSLSQELHYFKLSNDTYCSAVKLIYFISVYFVFTTGGYLSCY